MKISPISLFGSVSRVYDSKTYSQNPIKDNQLQNDTFVKSPVIKQQLSFGEPRKVSFMGYNIHIIDAGKHALEMANFAKLGSKGVDSVKLHRAEASVNWMENKPLKNIEEQLKEINAYGLTDKNSFVAIPVKITVSLQNLAEQYKRVTGDYLHLKPHSTQTCKNKLLMFLKTLYNNPKQYQKYIEYMDPENQGLEYAYGIIREINKLDCKKVYVPADYPNKVTLNWLANTKGETQELSNYLATGYDKDGKVQDMVNYIRGKEWYDFNLLALSKADVVNLKKVDGYSDHVYSAYDTTVNDGARGVYNLSPVRENGRIVGYSYKDTVTNEYSYKDFPYNEEIKDVARFVGLHVNDAVADDATTHEFRMALEQGRDLSKFSNKLYPVWQVFSEDKLCTDKIFEKGDFVDSTLKNYFRRNNYYEIIYPKADCENNGRPSVRAMWGSEYSMLNAIKRDIASRAFADDMIRDYNTNFNALAYGSYSSAKEAIVRNDYVGAQKLLDEAIEFANWAGFNSKQFAHIDSHNLMGDVKFKLGNYDGASWHYNYAINKLSKNVLEGYAKDDRPYLTTMDDRLKIHEMFNKLAEISRCRGEYYPEKECLRAAGEVKELSRLGVKVLERRADNDINIGDIFG